VRAAELRSINRGLRAMEWQRYLSAMWIICGELQDGFSDELGKADSPLIVSTRELIREVVLGRANYAGDASALYASWEQQCAHEDEVSHGLATFWALCRDLVSEVIGDTGKHYASSWIGNAVRERWRTPEERIRVEFPVWDPAEEIDDASPLGKFIELLQRIVTSAALYSGDLDPVLMREEILGK
jgi:hypothetical protein